ncbi:MAG: hypothetical protein IPG79_14390 [Saprospiraceae bacterium]|nr:hypothetical protein [Saprospiraceae bacterium]
MLFFCDEAQDFGRIELQFIIGLSEYLNYDLTPLSNLDQGIPVVFAGDAFQTVNPTGFRKAEVKDLFYTILNSKLDNNQYKPIYNYRSSQAIVNLSNSIQFFRKEKLNISGNPQKTKRYQETNDVYLDKFISIENIIENEDYYLQQLMYKTFIIPVDRFSKEDFINDHIFLKNYIDSSFKNTKEDTNYDLVRTAVEAKGVDYPQVVVYGFGDYF